MRTEHPETQQWVLEWSWKTNNLHVQLWARTVGINLSRFILNAATPNDYIPLLVGTYAEVTAAADRIRGTVIAREEVIAQYREVAHE